MKLFSVNREPIILFIVALLFYVVQIPSTTTNADALTFSIRSLNQFPIIDYAYLESSTLISNSALPNYHLGHTLIMWLFYKIIPNIFDSVLIISGFVSAISAALAVLLTYLIWLKLGFNKRISLIVSLLFALLPSFWEKALIGEIHSLQMLFILLYVYTFLNRKYIYSTAAFLAANLITPLSGLAFGLAYLGGFSKKILYRSIIVGFVSLLLYAIIFYLIGSDFSIILNEAVSHNGNRGLTYRVGILIFFTILNFNVFAPQILFGIKKLYSLKPKLLYILMIVTIPQLLLLFASSSFFIEKGSFQIQLFWGLTLPAGIAISNMKLKSLKFIISSILFVLAALVFWFYPHWEMSKSYSDAGTWLKQNEYQNYSIIGPWTVSIPIISKRNGNDIAILNKYYHDFPSPSDIELIKTGKEKLVISDYNKTYLRKKLSSLGIPGLRLNKYDPTKTIKIGNVEKIYKNKFVTLYRWEK